MMRPCWLFFGAAMQVLFVLTVPALFLFLWGSWPTQAWASSWWDVPLAVQFGLGHSLLLYPGIRQRLERFVPAPIYGCFFCTATCLSLWLTMLCWRPSAKLLWEAHGVCAAAITAAFVLSWIALFYSLSLNGLGWQTGWTPWFAWARGLPPPHREFNERGAYRVLRHPLYLSFLGLVWFSPRISLDRAALIGLWTTYIFVGSYLKDRRLLRYMGERYQEYQMRVPGFPFALFGPLGRVRAASDGARLQSEVSRLHRVRAH